MSLATLAPNAAGSTEQPKQTKETIIQLLSNLANPKEISLYLKRFVNAGKTQFAVIKVGGAILQNDRDNLCSSLSFLQQIGLYPILVHGAGPQLNVQLSKQNIDCQFIDGQRVTTPEVLSVAKKVFVQQNLDLADQLQRSGVKTASITSGVFTAHPSDNKSLGLVGKISAVDTDPITLAIQRGAIPIISPLAETPTGQNLNVNADVATNELAVSLQPYKIIFLTQTGGILDQNNQKISTVNLVTDYDALMKKSWLNGGMKLKLKQIAEILSQLPATASVSMTTPSLLAKELFTHKGSGTLVRRGESIMCHDSLETIKQKKLVQLLENSFQKKLVSNYFDMQFIDKAYITYCYRAAAVFGNFNQIAFLDKFVVGEDAKGEGLGKALWAKIKNDTAEFFWRCKPGNSINQFYFSNADGCIKSKNWNVYWVGLKDFEQIRACVDYALSKPESMITEETDDET